MRWNPISITPPISAPAARICWDLINDVLDISKIESGRLDIHRQRVVVRDEVEPVWKGFEIRAADKGMSLVLDVPDHPVECFADPRAVRQIVTNLVGNAVKYTQAGGTVLAQRP